MPIPGRVPPSPLCLREDAVSGPNGAPAYDTNAKINPPLRTERDRQALLRGVNEGVVDAIATDHAPHAIDDKLCEFDDAAFGLSCIETALGKLMTSVPRGEPALAAGCLLYTSDASHPRPRGESGGIPII